MLYNIAEVKDEDAWEAQSSYLSRATELVREAEVACGRKRTFHIETFGCQMNAHDSEKLSGILLLMGMEESEDDSADLVLYNTCTVRENANLKIYGRLGYLKAMKEKQPDKIIALCGCMMQEEEEIERIKKKYPFVDIVFGTHNFYEFPELFVQSVEEKRQVIRIYKDSSVVAENLPRARKYAFKSGVNIMYGCNNFCSYCIVPYVRGREKSRRSEDILKEIKDLAEDGVVEIMLLGQNVNSYGKTLPTPVSFASLLKQVEEIEGIERIRFMTSHPKDLSDDLIDVMAHSQKICRHLHLPLQSGSTEILKKMNRHYTKESYLALVDKLRDAMPDLAITTDIIVGFPGETEEDFAQTMEVVEKVRYDSAFTFIYSKRSGTPAAKDPAQVPEEVVKERFDRLLARVQTIGAEKSMAYEGQVLPVLCESVNHQDPSLMTGRLDNNSVVHFKGSKDLIGKIVSVHLKECRGFYYIGDTVS